MQASFLNWVQSAIALTQRQLVAFEGKSVRHCTRCMSGTIAPAISQCLGLN